LENWLAIVPVLHGWVDQWTGILSRLSVEIAIALSLLPIVLAILSKRWGVIAGCVLLTFSAFLMFISPSSVAAILEATLYLGSIVLAATAIFARRKEKNTEINFVTLRAEVDDLLAAEQRRLLRDIRSSSKDRASNVAKQMPAK
jgi:hypothetical protein